MSGGLDACPPNVWARRRKLFLGVITALLLLPLKPLVKKTFPVCGALLPQAAADSSNGRTPRARIHTARERELREACTRGPRLQKLLWADEVRSLVVSF